jgi:hypothetical protein
VLRRALAALLQDADMTAVSYAQLHKQLEEKFNVSGWRSCSHQS